jgi:uncharacterized protein YecE (DUF72 family)
VQEKRKMTKIYVGTSGYAYNEWKGRFYPEKISSKEMLRFYSGLLNTVEINNTFYRMPKESVLTSWAGQVPGDFVFALKAPQVITHLKRLRDVSEETRYLFKTLSALDRKLGPVLFQFPKSFRADRPALENLLGLIPDGRTCTFEFRSPSWIDAQILGLLRERGFSLCIADADENPANEMIGTASWGYLRLRRSDYTDADLSQWVERIRSQKWERVFVFFKHEGDDANGPATGPARGPEMAIRFRELADSREKRIKTP